VKPDGDTPAATAHPPMPPIQRCFLEWLEESRPRILVPIEAVVRTQRRLDILFPALRSPVLTGVLLPTEIAVSADWEGTCWDLVFCEDGVSPKRTPDGWICATCEHDAPQTGNPVVLYPSREALWRDHLFERFLAWVNDELSRAEAVWLCGEPDRMTWAVLVPNDARRADGPPTFAVPLR